jgi:hypothetical protein
MQLNQSLFVFEQESKFDGFFERLADELTKVLVLQAVVNEQGPYAKTR